MFVALRKMGSNSWFCLSRIQRQRMQRGIDSTTTEIAADIFRKKILLRHDHPNAYLFFDAIKDRSYVGERVSKMFKVLVTRHWHGRIRTTPHHIFIATFRVVFSILKSGGNDLFGLAKMHAHRFRCLKFYLTSITTDA